MSEITSTVDDTTIEVRNPVDGTAAGFVPVESARTVFSPSLRPTPSTPSF